MSTNYCQTYNSSALRPHTSLKLCNISRFIDNILTYGYLVMDVIGQVTRPVVQSQHPGHSWHMFGGLVWLRGSRTSVDDHPNVCPNDS